MIDIEKETTKYLLIIAESDDTKMRTTLGLNHQDGLELLMKLAAYYKDTPVDVPVLKEYLEMKRVMDALKEGQDDGPDGSPEQDAGSKPEG